MSAMPGKKTTNLSKSAAVLGSAQHFRPMSAQQRALVLGHLLYKLLPCKRRSNETPTSDCIAPCRPSPSPPLASAPSGGKPEAAPSMPLQAALCPSADLAHLSLSRLQATIAFLALALSLATMCERSETACASDGGNGLSLAALAETF